MKCSADVSFDLDLDLNLDLYLNKYHKEMDFSISYLGTVTAGFTRCQKLHACYFQISEKKRKKQEGHDGPVSLHWLIREIPSYQTLQYLGIGLKHMTTNKD